MARRSIVPDASVMLPAFFPETMVVGGAEFDVSRRAKPLRDAIRLRQVNAFAPEALPFEFVNKAHAKASPHGGRAAVDRDLVDEVAREFFGLKIIYVPSQALWTIALDLIGQGISPPDSWYVACAIHTDSDLWISHEHSDGLVQRARSFHDGVRLLVEGRFE